MKDRTWDAFHESVYEEIRWLKDGDFVSIEYGQEIQDTVSPYAQVAREDDYYWCEIVSNTYLPGDTWPLHGDILRDAGWNPPDEDCPNWYSERSGAVAATAAVIHGLRYGRACADPDFMEWHAATAPPQLG